MRFASLLWRSIAAGVIAVAFVTLSSRLSVHAGTIIKLNLGGVGPDLGMNAGGILSTTDDGDAATVGQQDTAIEFTGFLEPIPDVNTPIGSFTLSGLTASGPVQQIGSLAIQNFAGGQFNLYDPSNSLLLSGNLTTSALSGTIGQPATSGRSLRRLQCSRQEDRIAPSIASLSLSISMINVNGGLGLGISGNALQPFLADASALIAGDPQVNAPEPSTLLALSCWRTDCLRCETPPVSTRLLKGAAQFLSTTALRSGTYFFSTALRPGPCPWPGARLLVLTCSRKHLRKDVSAGTFATMRA